MPESAPLQQRVLSLLSEEMQLSVSNPATDLIDEGVLDSLVFVDLIARLEETFSFEIDLADLEIDEFRSVDQIARYVASATGVSHPAPLAEAAHSA